MSRPEEADRPESQAGAAESGGAPGKRTWGLAIVGVYALLLAGLLCISMIGRRQSRINHLVGQLGKEREAGKAAVMELTSIGQPALPYLARAFYYDDDVRVRRAAGTVIHTIVKSLEKELAEEGDGTGRKEWQEEMREVAASDMISKALRDEDAEVRELAHCIVAVIGAENKKYEEKRLKSWIVTKKQLEELRKNDEKAVERAKERLSEAELGMFPIPILIGVACDLTTKEPPHARKAAIEVVHKLLEAKYEADEREELATLVGKRRVWLLFELLAVGTYELVDEILQLSPRVSAEFVEEAKETLKNASATDRPALIKEYAAEHGRLEEGR